jgi:MFS family permease
MRVSWHFGLGRELGFVFWALTLFEAAYGAFSSIWPLWIAHLGASITVVGLVLGLAGVIRPIILLGGSWLSDRIDVRKMLVVSRCLLIVGIVFGAFAQTWELLLITVFFIGFGEIVFPVLHAHIPVHAGDNVARAFSLTCTIGPSVALIFTPLLTSGVIDVFGMRGALLLSAGFSVLGTLCMLGMNFSKDREFSHEETPATFADVARHRDARDIIAFHCVTIFVLGLGSMLLPNFLQEQRSMSPGLIALLSAGAAIGTTLFGLASLRVSGIRRAPFLAAALSCSCAALGFLMIGLSDLLPVISFAFVLRGGLFATWTFMLTAMGQYAPARLQARAFAIVEVLGGGAMSFSPVLASQLYGIHPNLPLMTATGFGLVMAGLIVLRYRRGFRLDEQSVPQVAVA